MAETQKRKRGKRLTMEKYLSFLHAEKRPDLPSVHLNQIIYMHGFRKFKKDQVPSRKVLDELVSKLELVEPSRSTVSDDGVTSDAVLGMEDILNDLNDLQWQESCITSIQMLSGSPEKQLRKVGGGEGPKEAVLKDWGPRKKRSLRRRKLVGCVVGNGTGDAPSSVANDVHV